PTERSPPTTRSARAVRRAIAVRGSRSDPNPDAMPSKHEGKVIHRLRRLVIRRFEARCAALIINGPVSSWIQKDSFGSLMEAIAAALSQFRHKATKIAERNH